MFKLNTIILSIFLFFSLGNEIVKSAAKHAKIEARIYLNTNIPLYAKKKVYANLFLYELDKNDYKDLFYQDYKNNNKIKFKRIIGPAIKDVKNARLISKVIGKEIKRLPVAVNLEVSSAFLYPDKDYFISVIISDKSSNYSSQKRYVAINNGTKYMANDNNENLNLTRAIKDKRFFKIDKDNITDNKIIVNIPVTVMQNKLSYFNARQLVKIKGTVLEPKKWLLTFTDDNKSVLNEEELEKKIQEINNKKKKISYNSDLVLKISLIKNTNPDCKSCKPEKTIIKEEIISNIKEFPINFELDAECNYYDGFTGPDYLDVLLINKTKNIKVTKKKAGSIHPDNAITDPFVQVYRHVLTWDKEVCKSDNPIEFVVDY